VRVALVYLDALMAGGYPRDARWLAGALESAGVSVRVVSRPGPHRDGLGQATVVAPGDFSSIAHESDVIHLWGFFLPDQFLMCRKLWGTGRFVVSPLGHLMWPHIRRKWWKKAPYLIAMQPLLRKRRHVVHFFSDAEAQDRSRRWLGGAADFQASLGIYPAPVRVNENADKPGDYLLFFGRNDIHQKGVDLLLQGYARAVGMGLSVPLVIAGQPHESSVRVLREMIDSLGLTHVVSVVGRVTDERKWELISGARCLVFLSRWDGPPRPVREGLAAGTPAVVSAGTNFGNVIQDSGAGVCVDSSPVGVGRGLLQTQSDATMASWRHATGGLRDSLSWSHVARQYEAGYQLTMEAVSAS
jgi:glycosyltransferase involved in cell wall biosynthesis